MTQGRLNVQDLIDQAVDGLIANSDLRKEDLDPAVVAGIVTDALRELGRKTAENLRRSTPAMLAEHHEIRDGFEARLAELWGLGLDALEAVNVAAFEAGENAYEDERRQGADDPQMEALILLHARACLVASEVLNLLRTGHASGALARWRTLHELAVVSLFIKEHDRRTAELYLLHAELLDARRLDAYQQYAEVLGETKFTADEVREIEARREEILAKVTDRRSFRSSRGWATEALSKRFPTFDDIQSATDLNHWRPWVALAHYPVHAGAAGSRFDLGRDGPMLLAGPSNAGLGAPGHNAAIALQLATVALLMYRPDGNAEIYLLAINQLVDDVGKAFEACEAEYERKNAAAPT
jgi:hypothetical protein